MAASFEPSHSTSHRAPVDALDAATMISDLPSVDFGFDELRDVMTKFTKRFDTFVANGRRHILDERNQYHLNVAELEEDEKMKRRDIEIMAQKASSHSQTVAKEASEAAEMEEAIHQITAQRDDRQQARDKLKAEITATRKAMAARAEAQRAHATKLEGQARFNSPELDFWTSSLCMDIEGAGKDDHLRFVFTHIDERDWEKEAWFELCTERRDYGVRGCKPKIASEKLEGVVEKLNETRDLGLFLKNMRQCFIEELKT